ncbi:MAG: SUMF1/EgtB/PvdO family nonheme iron enzyme, partial [Candidatus Competibacteraceae bacterium]|nr:SUMF1/EgtB/PvdO family nonheme iron enzyme [Candidatus Competibacteraceae bacterium]
MSDIFISYAAEDRSRVKLLAEALEAQGWSVWWDRSIPFGKPFDQVIEEQLAAAGCVIVVWSRHSIASDWVREEAHEGRQRKVLVPVLIDPVKPPFGFRRLQGADLGAWESGKSLPVFDKLLRDIAGVVGPPSRVAGQAAGGSPTQQQVEEKASKAEEVLRPSLEVTLPPVENIHGWPAERVRDLQRRTAEVLGSEVVFRDRLKDGAKGPEMVVIPAGKFLMGSPEDEPERRGDERQHSVTIERPFAIGRYEVMVGEFRRFVQESSYRTEAESGGGSWVWTGSEWKLDPARNWRQPGFKQSESHPVVCVSWNDGVAYAEWLSQQTGQEYRLPTEAEWEYAARAGTATPFHFGSTISPRQA